MTPRRAPGRDGPRWRREARLLSLALLLSWAGCARKPAPTALEVVEAFAAAIRAGDAAAYAATLDRERFQARGRLLSTDAHECVFDYPSEEDAVRRMFAIGGWNAVEVTVVQDGDEFVLRLSLDYVETYDKTRLEVPPAGVKLRTELRVRVETRAGRRHITRLAEVLPEAKPTRPVPSFGLLKYLHSTRFLVHSSEERRSASAGDMVIHRAHVDRGSGRTVFTVDQLVREGMGDVLTMRDDHGSKVAGFGNAD